MASAAGLTEIFKALSVETRVKLITLLKKQPLCVNALAMRLKITSAAVSQHLRVLRAAHLVIPEKRGYHVHYRINNRTLAKWADAADELLNTAPEADTQKSST